MPTPTDNLQDFGRSTAPLADVSSTPSENSERIVDTKPPGVFMDAEIGGGGTRWALYNVLLGGRGHPSLILTYII